MEQIGEIRALALDPGVTTGYALGTIRYDTKDRTTATWMEIVADQEQFTCLTLFDFLHDENPHHIICESFEFRQRKQVGNLELYSRNLIGVIQLYMEKWKRAEEEIGDLERYAAPQLHMQTAAKGKGYYDNNKLKEAGVYLKGKEHARDAIRHLMQWINFEAGFQYRVKTITLA